MRVLTVTPTVKLGMDTLHALYGQTYAGPNDHMQTFDNPERVAGQNIIYNYRKLQAVFLSGGYDALWVVEDDVLPPPTALEQLLAVGADIAYGVYCFRRGIPVINIMHPRTRDPMAGQGAAWARLVEQGAIVDCNGLGLGCTLIQRHVLERFPFRTETGGGDVDTCLANDAAAAGLTQKAHLGVLCGHRDSLTSVLWPTTRRPYWERRGPKTPRTQRVRILRPVALFEEAYGQRIGYPGDELVVEQELAQSLAPVGVLEIMP